MREAVEADIPDILDMGERFVSGNGWAFRRDVAEKTVRHLIVSEEGAIFITDGGMIAGMVYPHYFNGALTGQELWWWVEKAGTGVELLTALEEWARGKGAESFTVMALEVRCPERVGSLYKRRGYEPVEHHYMRAL